MKFKRLYILGGTAVICGLLLATFGSAAVKGIFGFAAAGSSNKWHNVKDVSAGDALASGSLAVSPCMWNGSNCDRIRGDITNGLDVDVTRIGGSVTVTGTSTPSDNASNPTTAIITDSRLSVFDGSTWDRLNTILHTDNLATLQGLNTSSFTYGFDGTNWDRIRGDSTNGLDVKVTNASSMGSLSNQTTHLNAATAPQFSAATDFTGAICNHSWQTTITGSPTGVTVSIEGSLNGNEWFIMDSSTSTSNFLRHFNSACISQIRANLSVLSGGTAPTVTVKTISTN